jgi:hypothetical protein
MHVHHAHSSALEASIVNTQLAKATIDVLPKKRLMPE